MKIIIIGGGWFGNYLGYKLKGRYEVILLEENSRIMMNAATKNQNRLHLGFHYPRSSETIIQSQSGFEKFKLEFPFLTEKIPNNIYSISKYSQVSPEDYLSVMSEHNLSYKVLSKKEERALTLKNIDLSIKVDEELILSKKAQKFFSMENSNILKCDSKVVSIDSDLKKVHTNHEQHSYDILINTTYSDTNKLYDFGGKASLKFEYCVLPIYKSMRFMKNNFALTVMDGSFVSLYPYRKNFFTLSSVANTPLAVYDEDITKKEELEMWQYLKNQYFLDKKYEQFESELYDYIDKQYMDINHFSQFFTRKVKYKTDNNDCRDTRIIYENSIISVYPGKIDSVIYTYREICKILCI